MGLQHIQQTFARARSEMRPALMPYWTLGYPDASTSVRVIKAIVSAGADMLELGIPFSDPLADGPVIQRASQIALENGASVRGCIELASELRASGINVPMIAMGYVNPLLAYGVANYVRDWHAAGVDGFIVPDLPPEEGGEMAEECTRKQMALVQFTAPTSTPQRVKLAVQHATGFIYVVAVTGVTGARDSLAIGLREYVERVKTQTGELPVVVGFGVSKPEHVREIGEYADGVIVASALLRAAGEAADPAINAAEFVRSLRDHT